MPEPAWVMQILNLDTVRGMERGDGGVRYIQAYLTCGHREDAHSEMGGFDEEPFAVPGFPWLADILEQRIQRHDCAEWERRHAVKADLPF